MIIKIKTNNLIKEIINTKKKNVLQQGRAESFIDRSKYCI